MAQELVHQLGLVPELGPMLEPERTLEQALVRKREPALEQVQVLGQVVARELALVLARELVRVLVRVLVQGRAAELVQARVPVLAQVLEQVLLTQFWLQPRLN